MKQKIRELLTFPRENDGQHQIKFRRLRKTRPAKKVWLMAAMAIALAYLIYTLKIRF